MLASICLTVYDLIKLCYTLNINVPEFITCDHGDSMCMSYMVPDQALASIHA